MGFSITDVLRFICKLKGYTNIVPSKEDTARIALVDEIFPILVECDHTEFTLPSYGGDLKLNTYKKKQTQDGLNRYKEITNTDYDILALEVDQGFAPGSIMVLLVAYEEVCRYT